MNYMENHKFYCYSKRLFHFIKSFNIDYLSVGINTKSHNKYFVFEKSDKLDKIISLYNEVKHSIR